MMSVKQRGYGMFMIYGYFWPKQHATKKAPSNLLPKLVGKNLNIV